MQEKTTRQAQAQLTRKKLFDAAYRLLQEKSFEEISISQIARESGVSVGTFYLYFSSKLDVYYQTYVMAEEYFETVVAARVENGTTLEKLLTYFYEYACYNSDYTSIKLTKLLYNGENKCFLRPDNGRGMLAVLKNIVRAGLEMGDLDPAMSAGEISAFLMNAIRGLTYHWCISDGSYDIKEATRDYVLRLYRAIEKRP